MAAAVDGTSPARFEAINASGGTLSSAAFTAPANSLLVLCIEIDGASVVTATPNGTLTVTIDLTTGAALTWTEQVRRAWNEGTDGGASLIFTAPAVTSESRVVRVTTTWTTNTGSNLRKSAKLYVVTGADISGTPVDSVSASNEGTDTTNNSMTTTSVTPGANGLLFAADCEWNARGLFDASSDLTQNTQHYAGAISVCDGYKAVTSGVGATANLDAAGASAPQHKWCQIVVREAGGGGGGRTTKNTRAFPLGLEVGMNWQGSL